MKIALTSTHSAGKTSLVKALSELPEFKDYQFYTEKTKQLKEEFKVKLNDDSQLVSQYIFMGERAKELHSSDNFISDRSIYDVCAYSLGAKSIPFCLRRLLVESCVPLTDEYDVIIYVDPIGVKIEDNGLRSVDPIYRDKINHTIQELLFQYPPKKLIKVSGSTEQRIVQIKGVLFP